MISLVGKSYFLDKASADPLMGSLLPLISQWRLQTVSLICQFRSDFCSSFKSFAAVYFVFAGKKLKI